MVTNPATGRGLLVGTGIALGAGLGLLFGTLLSADLVWSVPIGAVAGLLAGAIIDLQRRRGG